MTAWIEELERLSKEATPGQFYHAQKSIVVWVRTSPEWTRVTKCDRPADAALIAAMRNALPRLLAAARLADEIEQEWAWFDTPQPLSAKGLRARDRIRERLAAYREAMKAK